MTTSGYWPYFCEENVWHLAGNLAGEVEQAHVVVISNPARQVAIWAQAAARAPDEPIIWDYHVILLELAASGWRVIDPDSTLEPPIEAERYLATSFRALDDELSEFRPMFRVVAAAEYRAVLCSDRSHMRDAAGEWLAPPPPDPLIGQGPEEGGTTNLLRFVDMEQPFIGQVCDLDGLYARIRTD